MNQQQDNCRTSTHSCCPLASSMSSPSQSTCSLPRTTTSLTSSSTSDDANVNAVNVFEPMGCSPIPADTWLAGVNDDSVDEFHTLQIHPPTETQMITVNLSSPITFSLDKPHTNGSQKTAFSLAMQLSCVTTNALNPKTLSCPHGQLLGGQLHTHPQIFPDVHPDNPAATVWNSFHLVQTWDKLFIDVCKQAANEEIAHVRAKKNLELNQAL